MFLSQKQENKVLSCFVINILLTKKKTFKTIYMFLPYEYDYHNKIKFIVYQVTISYMECRIPRIEAFS